MEQSLLKISTAVSNSRKVHAIFRPNPITGKNNALSALLAGFSEEYLNRMQEQEERMYIKEVFAGRQKFQWTRVV